VTLSLPVALVIHKEDTSGLFLCTRSGAKVHVRRDEMQMERRSLMRIFSAFSIKHFTPILVTAFVATGYARAQDPLPETMSTQTVEISSLSPLPSLLPMHESASGDAAFPPPTPIIESGAALKKATTHRFWDRENRILFAATGMAATGDFLVTHANLSSGGRELDPVARLFTGSTPALACNFALQTTGVMAASYLFHKTGHHRLERLTSVVSVTASSSAVAYGLTHR
jgi:hypothetical protein